MSLQHAPNAFVLSTQFQVALEDLKREISSCTRVSDVKSLRDKAESVRLYARNARFGLETQNKAAEIRLRAERRAGELLRQMKLRGGDRRSNRRDARLKLADIGISQSQSARWQQLARIDEDEFGTIINLVQSSGKELTANVLIRIAHQRAGLKPRERSRRRKWRPAHYSSNYDLVNELAQHHRLIASIVGDVIVTDGGSLQRCERKHLAYLLKESERILDVLLEMQSRGPTLHDQTA